MSSRIVPPPCHWLSSHNSVCCTLQPLWYDVKSPLSLANPNLRICPFTLFNKLTVKQHLCSMLLERISFITLPEQWSGVTSLKTKIVYFFYYFFEDYRDIFYSVTFLVIFLAQIWLIFVNIYEIFIVIFLTMTNIFIQL